MQNAFGRLGLSPDADARDIRKAYARELKKIDQENDAAGFQSLREAYESALRKDQTPSREAPQAPPASPVKLPEPLARAAWSQCLEMMKQSPCANETSWENALRHALASDVLLNLHARLWFEALVVAMLASGWRPGHDTLLIAASKVFGWDENPLRLTEFQRNGAIIRRAIEEQRLMAGLSLAERTQMRAAIIRLQDNIPPTPEDLQQHTAALMRLNQLFPTLVDVVIDTNTFRLWRRAKIELPANAEAPTGISWHRLGTSALALLILVLMAFLLQPALLPYLSRSPYQSQLEKIGARVTYKAKPSQKKILSVESRVSVNADGSISDIQVKHPSGDADFDTAVATAIHQKTLLPPSGGLYHRLNFSKLPPGFSMDLGGIWSISQLPSGTILLPD